MGFEKIELNTHVLSLIVNMAQGGLEKDWPVEVFDHNGRLHEVIMEPGVSEPKRASRMERSGVSREHCLLRSSIGLTLQVF